MCDPFFVILLYFDIDHSIETRVATKGTRGDGAVGEERESPTKFRSTC